MSLSDLQLVSTICSSIRTMLSHGVFEYYCYYSLVFTVWDLSVVSKA